MVAQRLNSELIKKAIEWGGMCLQEAGAGAALKSEARLRDGKVEAQFSAPLHPAAWTCACLSQDVLDIC